MRPPGALGGPCRPPPTITPSPWCPSGGTMEDMRSKSRVLTKVPATPEELPAWNYDGSSTGQASHRGGGARPAGGRGAGMGSPPRRGARVGRCPRHAAAPPTPPAAVGGPPTLGWRWAVHAERSRAPPQRGPPAAARPTHPPRDDRA